MPSPFPGMDPYLEQHWGDVHSGLVQYARDLIRPGLPQDLYARVEERVYVESPLDDVNAPIPDLRVVEHPTKLRPNLPVESDVAVIEPIVLHIREEELRETYIEIRDSKSDHQVVTVVEVLSPSNKRTGSGREEYVRKQKPLRNACVSLVEIDLLRSGQPTFPVSQANLPRSHRTPYRVCIRRGWSAGKVEVHPIRLQQKLPGIPIPLRNDDESVVLDLQSAFAPAYENGDYEMTIDYTADPVPPLEPDDAEWADKLLKEKGLR